MKKIFWLIFLFLVACAPAEQQELKIVIAPTQTLTSTLVPTVTPTVTLVPTTTPIPTVSNTPIPSESIRGLAYEGYWLKVVKVEDRYGSWSMSLYYQSYDRVDFVTDFCVRGSDTNTADGFYFLADERATRFTVNGEYFSSDRNFVTVFAKDNWYIHPAPWNNGGIDGCPNKSSSGCINMRQSDLDLLFDGGRYRNVYRTEEAAEIPVINIGTPLVIVDNNIDCLWLGQCMQHLQCKSGWECFRKYTCRYCNEAEAHERWAKVLRSNLSAEMLDTQK